VEPGHPFTDRQPIDLLDRDVLTFFDLEKMFAELLEIARIIPQRGAD
jgi:hypothetical protein